jgi:hypothetical protein
MGGASRTIAARQQRVVHLDTQVPDDALDFGVSRKELDSGQVGTAVNEDQDRCPSRLVSARWPAGMFSQGWTRCKHVIGTGSPEEEPAPIRSDQPAPDRKVHRT